MSSRWGVSSIAWVATPPTGSSPLSFEVASASARAGEPRSQGGGGASPQGGRGGGRARTRGEGGAVVKAPPGPVLDPPLLQTAPAHGLPQFRVGARQPLLLRAP